MQASKRIVPTVIALSLCAGGCDAVLARPEAAAACVALGMCDEAERPRVEIVVFCDSSLDSTCSQATLERTLDSVLAHVADRPGSRVQLWMLGEDVGHTAAVAEQTVPELKSGSERAQGARRKSFIAAARESLVSSAKSAFRSPRARRSPLVESIVKIALAGDARVPRSIVALTDAREVSALGDFECRPVPSEKAFLARLDRRGLLAPGTLAGVKVVFAFVDASPVARRACPVRLERELRIRALWRAALARAGAEFSITAGAPALADEPTVATKGAETP